MNEPITVIHHSADFDGLFCGEIAKKFLPPGTKVIGWDFGNAPLTWGGLGKLYVMDLPIDAVFGFDFSKPETVPDSLKGIVWESSQVVWIDHHKSSIESHPKNIPGHRIDGVAFCQLFGTMVQLPRGFPMYCRDVKQLCDDRGNPKLPEQVKSPEHNSMNDAIWTKEAYEFLKALPL